MMMKRLYSVFKSQYTKRLSTVPLAKVENELPVEIEDHKEKGMLQHPDYFQVHNLFTVNDLFKAGVHYGHKVSTLNKNMKPFVFGNRLGHVIFDLDITAYHLREALNFAAHIAYRGGIILFVSKNPAMTLLVEKTAQECKEFALTREWLLGLLTNSEHKFKAQIRLPDLMIMLNTIEENGMQHQGVLEAAKMCIPTIGIVDSNCNPNLVTYPVPGNDDTHSCFELYCKLFKTAILRGKIEMSKQMENAQVKESVTAIGELVQSISAMKELEEAENEKVHETVDTVHDDNKEDPFKEENIDTVNDDKQ